ncbi:MAG: hypothetical protein ACRD2J_07050 [Thermoanaerobaculia bacterium]
MRTRAYAVPSCVRILGLAAAVAAAPALFTARAQTVPVSGPITPDNIRPATGIAGPANPLTFDPTTRPGIAGPANPLTFDPLARPGIAGPGRPAAVTQPAIVEVAPLNGGLTTPLVNVGVADPSAFPLLTQPGVAGTTFAPGIAGPVNPLFSNATIGAGVAGTTLAPGVAGQPFFDPFAAAPVQDSVTPAPDGRDRSVQRPVAAAATTPAGTATGSVVILGIPGRTGSSASVAITNEGGRVRVVSRR